MEPSGLVWIGAEEREDEADHSNSKCETHPRRIEVDGAEIAEEGGVSEYGQRVGDLGADMVEMVAR